MSSLIPTAGGGAGASGAPNGPAGDSAPSGTGSTGEASAPRTAFTALLSGLLGGGSDTASVVDALRTRLGGESSTGTSSSGQVDLEDAASRLLEATRDGQTGAGSAAGDGAVVPGDLATLLGDGKAARLVAAVRRQAELAANSVSGRSGTIAGTVGAGRADGGGQAGGATGTPGATGAAGGVTAADPTTPNDDPSQLDPEFRARLERVIQRMQQEFGHDVEITEGFRSQARQDRLYAQGRTRPGEVVTWTRNSAHTGGYAADVIIDGSYENDRAYRRLARIAEQEGLTTLGSKDRVHLELPERFRDASSRVAGASRGDGQSGSGNRGRAGRPGAARVATPARISAVAEVADPSRVADVARVARPGSAAGAPAAGGEGGPSPGTSLPSSGSPAGASRPAGPTGASPTVDADVQPPPAARNGSGAAASGAGSSGGSGGPANTAGLMSLGSSASGSGGTSADAGSTSSGGSGSAGTGSGSSGGGQTGAADAQLEAFRSTTSAGSSEQAEMLVSSATRSGDAASFAGRVEAATAASGGAEVTAAERAQQIRSLQETSRSNRLSRIFLRMEGADGQSTRVRVGMQGNMVDASVGLTDSGAAEQLRARVDELHRTLQRRGLEGESLTFRTLQAADPGGSSSSQFRGNGDGPGRGFGGAPDGSGGREEGGADDGSDYQREFEQRRKRDGSGSDQSNQQEARR